MLKENGELKDASRREMVKFIAFLPLLIIGYFVNTYLSQAKQRNLRFRIKIPKRSLGYVFIVFKIGTSHLWKREDFILLSNALAQLLAMVTDNCRKFEEKYA